MKYGGPRFETRIEMSVERQKELLQEALEHLNNAWLSMINAGDLVMFDEVEDGVDNRYLNDAIRKLQEVEEIIEDKIRGLDD